MTFVNPTKDIEIPFEIEKYESLKNVDSEGANQSEKWGSPTDVIFLRTTDKNRRYFTTIEINLASIGKSLYMKKSIQYQGLIVLGV